MPKVRPCSDGGYSFFCPGCQEWHHVTSGWQFNGSVDQPTFRPSILVRSGHYVPGYENALCWCTWSERYPDKGEAPFKCQRCHSFVTDGRIQYLGDCTHALAGQTVEMLDVEDDSDA